MGGGIVAFPAIWDFSGKVAMVTSAARHRPGDKRCSIMSPSRTASAVVLAACVLAPLPLTPRIAALPLRSCPLLSKPSRGQTKLRRARP